MSTPDQFLLTPYRLPSQNTLYLGEDDVASYLNGYAAPYIDGGGTVVGRIRISDTLNNGLATGIFVNQSMTLGTLELDSRCGLLFLDWERGDSLQVTGRARVDWSADRAAAVPGAQRLVDFDVERVVHIAGGCSLRWSFGTYFRHNPSAHASVV